MVLSSYARRPARVGLFLLAEGQCFRSLQGSLQKDEQHEGLTENKSLSAWNPAESRNSPARSQACGEVAVCLLAISGTSELAYDLDACSSTCQGSGVTSSEGESWRPTRRRSGSGPLHLAMDLGFAGFSLPDTHTMQTSEPALWQMQTYSLPKQSVVEHRPAV